MRASARAIVHLHSTHSVAVSCLAGIDAADVLPPLTAYYVMRVGRLPLIPYFPPGDERLAAAVRQVAARHAAVLLANHGPVVAGASLDAAVGAVEELEATAKLFLLLQGQAIRPLTAPEVEELEARFPRHLSRPTGRRGRWSQIRLKIIRVERRSVLRRHLRGAPDLPGACGSSGPTTINRGKSASRA